MKSTIILFALIGGAHSAWLRWSVNREPVWTPQETGRATQVDAVGWSPVPTPAPGVVTGEVVLDLFKRQTTSNNWTNSETCGWFSGVSSSAVMCGNDFTCATNSDHIVACASGTVSQFFSACLDYSAFQDGKCNGVDSATGCCQQETEPACGTYLWTGQPHRTMYKCFETASVVSILDVPQFVVDASIFSKTHTTPTPTPTPTTISGSIVSTITPGTAIPDAGSSSPSSSSSSSTNNHLGAIIGGVVGGIAGLLLILLLLFCMTRKNKQTCFKLGLTSNRKTKKEDNSKKAFYNHKHDNIERKRASSIASSSVAARDAPASISYAAHHHHHHHHDSHNIYEAPNHAYGYDGAHAHSHSPYVAPTPPAAREARKSLRVGAAGSTERDHDPVANVINIYYPPQSHSQNQSQNQHQYHEQDPHAYYGSSNQNALGLSNPNPNPSHVSSSAYANASTTTGAGFGHGDGNGHSPGRGRDSMASELDASPAEGTAGSAWGGAGGPRYRQSM